MLPADSAWEARLISSLTLPYALSTGESDLRFWDMPTFYEFFAGGGMARAGLGPRWHCLFANDFSAMKAKAYRDNWGDEDFVLADIGLLTTTNLPGEADLVWASSPCQDVSLAGKNQGLGAADAEVLTRSGTFWHFWRLIQALGAEGRAPKVVVLENVCGIITSNQGADFTAIVSAFAQENYRVGAVVIDAALFVPQSRKRVFIVGVRADSPLPFGMQWLHPSQDWHPVALRRAHANLPASLRQAWVWWNLPMPTPRSKHFIDVLEDEPIGVKWHSFAATHRLLSLMSEVHLQKN